MRPTVARDDDRLAKSIEKALSRVSLARASWGIEVRDGRTARALYAKDAQKNLKPASTFKLLVTAAALDTFGPYHRFQTNLQTAGRVDGYGRLLGDLYLVGGGETTLSWKRAEGETATAFEKLASDLRSAGITRVEGRLIGAEVFRGERRGDDWGWEDLTWCYGAEVSALSMADNCVEIVVAPGERPGDPARVDFSPRSRAVTVSSTVTTVAREAPAELTLFRPAGTNHVQLSGTVALGAPEETLRAAVENPALYAATVFAETLEAQGTRIVGPVTLTADPLPAGLKILATHEGPPMAEVLAGVNKPSQNLHTEMLLRALGLRAGGEGSVEAGHKVVSAFLSRAGIDAAQVGMRDGSGLSRTDLLTSADLVRLLVFMDKHPHAAVFRASLPVAGIDGTLKRRLKGTEAEGRVFAKTGSLRGVSVLAGYAVTTKGEPRTFAILCNNFTAESREATAAIDEIVLAIVGR